MQLVGEGFPALQTPLGLAEHIKKAEKKHIEIRLSCRLLVEKLVALFHFTVPQLGTDIALAPSFYATAFKCPTSIDFQ